MRALILHHSFDSAVGQIKRQSAGLSEHGAVRLQSRGLAGKGQPPVGDHDIHLPASLCQCPDIDQILAPRD